MMMMINRKLDCLLVINVPYTIKRITRWRKMDVPTGLRSLKGKERKEEVYNEESTKM